MARRKIDKVALANLIRELEGLDNEQRADLMSLLNEQKTFGLVWEEKPEDAQEKLRTEIPVLKEVPEKRLDKGGKDAPNHVLIEADNLHAVTALMYSHEGKFDAIYIDPPYNTGNKDWRYNNDYVDDQDSYRHSKWLSLMYHRLLIAKKLLNPDNSVLIITIDDKEYLHLGCMLEQLFPMSKLTMVSSVINPSGKAKKGGVDFSRTDEYIFFVQIGTSVVLPENRDFSQTPITWEALRRHSLANGRGKHGVGACGPNQFYPFYVDNTTKKIVDIGNPIMEDTDRFTVESKEGCTTVFPVRDDGTEMNWGCVREEALKRLSKGYLKVGSYFPKKPQQYSIQYLTSGTIKAIESGDVVVTGRSSDGGVEGFFPEGKPKMPTTNWNKPMHNATSYGTDLLSQIFGGSVFDYPKSVYAVEDALKLFLMYNQSAKILDFFAGSGTTLHATMQLNAEDGGHRQCILVTNNENNICEEVTYERNKRVIEGYTTPKGDKVEGLKNNNLRYYKVDFVPRDNSVEAKRKLMEASTDLVCIKHDVYQELDAFGSLKLKPHFARYFAEKGKQILIIYKAEAIEYFVKEIAAMPDDTNILVYVFSTNNYAMDADFEDVADKVTLCALPAAIYNAYLKVLPKKTTMSQDEEESINQTNEED